VADLPPFAGARYYRVLRRILSRKRRSSGIPTDLDLRKSHE
jgi:hypothetical protein